MMAVDFQAIRRDHPLDRVVGSTLKLVKAGGNKAAVCPFHPDRNPSLVLFPDQTYHCFGCGAHGDVIDYVAATQKLSAGDAIRYLTGGSAPVLDAADRERRDAERKARDASHKRNQDNAIQAARGRWARALAVNGTGSEYLFRKNVAPYGCRREGDNLLVPIFDADGLILSVQSIAPDGAKLFHAGAPMAGGHMYLGKAADGPIVIVEGFATGGSVQAATGYLVAVAFSKANLVSVARAVSERHPGRAVVIGADTNGVGKAEEAAAAIGARVVLPDLQGAEGSDFNDQAAHYGFEDVAALFQSSADIGQLNDRAIKATAFTWRAEEAIPKREWIYGKHLLRRFVSVDVAAGGVGKSSLKIGEALAMASGRDLYSKGLHDSSYRVWLYNLEDPNEETERRIHATAKHFKLSPDDLGDRLYVDSGRDQRCVIAEETQAGVQIVRPIVDALIAEIQERKIDVLIIDPFVSSHGVSENDNMAIDMVVKEWARVADVCNCSINLVHHVRKQNGQEATADSARGASSLIGAARSVMVFNRMTKEEATAVGLGEDEARFHFRVDNDKANLAPPTATNWYRMNNVDLVNGDSVGVACPWQVPNVFDGVSTHDLRRVQNAIGAGEYREDSRAASWVGKVVAAEMRLDIDQPKDRRKVMLLLKEWLKTGALEVVEQTDLKSNKRNFVIVGRWVDAA